MHELAGKRLMIGGESAELVAYLQREGLNPGRYDLLGRAPDGLQRLLSGGVDAIAAYVSDQPFAMEQAGVEHLVFTPRARTDW